MKRAWVSSYNHRFRKFDNGICWYRLYVRLGSRWFTPGGVWISRAGRVPKVRYLRPDAARGPISQDYAA